MEVESFSAYLCPDPWRPTGLIHPEVYALSIRTSVQDDGSVEAEA